MGRFRAPEWLDDLKQRQVPFTDNKGYLLPQFSYPGLKSGHLKHFILHDSWKLVAVILDYLMQKPERAEIYQVTDIGNKWLNDQGYKKQNFVLTAFACDLAEYFPDFVDPKSRLYAGTNATKCIKSIYPKVGKVKEFDYINDVLEYQAERYDLNPMDCEDSRNCDIIRYLKEYQSKEHITKNGGVMLNNSVLKSILGILAVGGIGTLLFTFKDQILNFFENSANKVFDIIKSKSTGFRDFVRDSVKEFFIDANKSGLFTTVRDRSQERLDESLSEAKSLDDIVKANQAEIKNLQEEKRTYEKLNPDKKKY